MNKAELVAHLANLTFVMDFHEKLGTTKNPLVVKEFHQCHQQLVAELEKEHGNEAGSRKLIGSRFAEDRANVEGSQPRRSIEYREHGGAGPSGEGYRHRSGI